MAAEKLPAHAPYLPVPYEHRWRSPDEQLSASRDFLATMALRRTVRDFAQTPVPFELMTLRVGAQRHRERRPRCGPGTQRCQPAALELRRRERPRAEAAAA